MSVIIDGKNGFLIHEWDVDTKSYKKTVPDTNLILRYLRDDCHITEGTTLLDIFNAVEKYPLLKLIISEYSHCFHIDKYHEEAKLPFVKTYKEINYLQISRIEAGLEVLGIGKKNVYSVIFLPLTTISNLNIKIKDRTSCTFLEVLDAIYDEISCHGSPEERDKKIEELQKTIQEIKNG